MSIIILFYKELSLLKKKKKGRPFVHINNILVTNMPNLVAWLSSGNKILS